MPSDASGRRLMAFVCALLGVASVAATPTPASAPPPADHAFSASGKATPTKPVVPVDINSASPAQLKTLPGIGDAEAARIVASRPYLSKADLATKGVVPAGVYLSLKDRVIAIQKSMPKKVAVAP